MHKLNCHTRDDEGQRWYKTVIVLEAIKEDYLPKFYTPVRLRKRNRSIEDIESSCYKWFA